MNGESVRHRLLECFRAVFPGRDDQSIEALSAESDSNWDSVTQVTLMSVLEEEFGTTIPEEKYGELTSFLSLLTYLKSFHASA